MNIKNLAALYALAAASLYALSIPFAKLLLSRVPAPMMAAFLYLGAGVGMLCWSALSRAAGRYSKTAGFL